MFVNPQAMSLCHHNAYPSKCNMLPILNSLHAVLKNVPGKVFFVGYTTGLYIRYRSL